MQGPRATERGGPQVLTRPARTGKIVSTGPKEEGKEAGEEEKRLVKRGKTKAPMFFHARLFPLLASIVVATTLQAGYAFRIADVTALPETPRLHLGLFLTGTGTITGFKATIAHHPIDMLFVESAVAGSILEGVPNATVTAVPDAEVGKVTITGTLGQPLGLPGGEATLLDLVFSIGGGIPAGSVLPVTFDGSPAVTAGGSNVQGTGTNGSVAIPNDNFLILEDTSAYPGQSNVPMDLTIFNKDPLMGLSVSVSFDTTSLRLVDIVADGTMTEALGAEFFQPVISNQGGYFVLGILLDDQPPVNPTLRYPATGDRLLAARLLLEVKADAPQGTDTTLAFKDGFHTPPISNRVVVENQSVVPQKIDGVVHIGTITTFVRGNPNNDSRVNIADPVRILEHLFKGKPLSCHKAADVNDDGAITFADVTYELGYLFLFGPVIPLPFPEPGVDPTPDDLTCEHYGM
jgi:hypothetical protein